MLSSTLVGLAFVTSFYIYSMAITCIVRDRECYSVSAPTYAGMFDGNFRHRLRIGLIFKSSQSKFVFSASARSLLRGAPYADQAEKSSPNSELNWEEVVLWEWCFAIYNVGHTTEKEWPCIVADRAHVSDKKVRRQAVGFSLRKPR